MVIDYGAGANGFFLEDIQDVLHITQTVKGM